MIVRLISFLSLHFSDGVGSAVAGSVGTEDEISLFLWQSKSWVPRDFVLCVTSPTTKGTWGGVGMRVASSRHLARLSPRSRLLLDPNSILLPIVTQLVAKTLDVSSEVSAAAREPRRWGP